VVVVRRVGGVEGGVDVVVSCRLTRDVWEVVEGGGVNVVVRLTRRVSSSSCYLLMKSIKIEI